MIRPVSADIHTRGIGGITLGAADEQIGQCQGAGGKSYRSSGVKALAGLAADPMALGGLSVIQNPQLVMHPISYIGAAYAVFFGWYLAQRWGENARLDLLLSLVAANVVLGIAAHYYEHSVRRELQSMDPRTSSDMRRHDSAAAEFDRDRPRVNERQDWSWRAMDVLGGIAFIFYPAVIYSALRYRSFNGDTPFDGFAVIAVVLGAFGYGAWRRRRLRSYLCPICQTSASAQLDSPG